MMLSKTDIPCDCSWLQMAADNPEMPVEFDARLNEYTIVYSEGKGHLNIRHCPFCGDAAPKSKRDLMFARIADDEWRRMVDLTKSLRTLSDVLSALGSPDKDLDLRTIADALEEDNARAVPAYRQISYTHLSETTEITIAVYPGDTVAISFSGKYLGDAALSDQL